MGVPPPRTPIENLRISHTSYKASQIRADFARSQVSYTNQNSQQVVSLGVQSQVNYTDDNSRRK